MSEDKFRGTVEDGRRKGTVDNVNLIVPIKPFAIVTVCLPGVSLAICFITGFLFRFEDVNETMCEVSNFSLNDTMCEVDK